MHCGTPFINIENTKKEKEGKSMCDICIYNYPKTKTVFIYDIYLEENEVLVLKKESKNGSSYYKKDVVDIDKLRKYVKKGDFDKTFLIGMTIKKDGNFKLKPKQLKDYEDTLEEHVKHFKKHYKHMKTVKKQLKAEKEFEDYYEETHDYT